MGDDLDLDAIERDLADDAASGIYLNRTQALSLISALRRETEARKIAEAERADAGDALLLIYDQREAWRASALAAEAVANAFDGVTAESCLSAHFRLRKPPCTAGEEDVANALDRLALVLRDRERSAP